MHLKILTLTFLTVSGLASCKHSANSKARLPETILNVTSSRGRGFCIHAGLLKESTIQTNGSSSKLILESYSSVEPIQTQVTERSLKASEQNELILQINKLPTSEVNPYGNGACDPCLTYHFKYKNIEQHVSACSKEYPEFEKTLQLLH